MKKEKKESFFILIWNKDFFVQIKDKEKLNFEANEKSASKKLNFSKFSAPQTKLGRSFRVSSTGRRLCNKGNSCRSEA